VFDPRPPEDLAGPGDPEAALLGVEMISGVARALDELPPDRKAAFLLRVDRELGYAEIAGHMDWPISKVKNEIHRARAFLRSALAIGVMLIIGLVGRVPTSRPPSSDLGSLVCQAIEPANPICEAPLVCEVSDLPLCE
jgi:hypothetical protein